MELVACASFAVLVAAWVTLPLRAAHAPSLEAVEAEPLSEPAAA